MCEAVESLGPSCHFFDSFFLLCANEPPMALQKELRLRVEGQANIFLTRLAREQTEHLPREARDWLAAHLDSHTDCND